MKQSPDWQDLKLFSAIAKGGGLAEASRESGVSAPTLGRRMTALEDTLGERLFERGSRGYSLTRAGEVLLDHVSRMNDAAKEIEHWAETDQSTQHVRISAGGWTMQLLLDNLARYWKPTDNWVPEFVTDFSRRDVARREIDIGVRQGRPTEAWLAGKRVGNVDYAIYKSVGTQQDDTRPVWIGVGEEHAQSPTGDWDQNQHGATLSINVNMSSMGLPLVRQGIARMAMPCFIGDHDANLERDGDLLKEFSHERWLVMHQENRHRPHVRSAIDALSEFLTSY